MFDCTEHFVPRLDQYVRSLGLSYQEKNQSPADEATA